MSALYDRMVAADDAREFAHDHAPEILREMLMVEQVVAHWERIDLDHLATDDGDGAVKWLTRCITETREAMA